MFNSVSIKRNFSFKMTMLSLLSVGLLAGCGSKGPLKTPPPLFGGDTKVEPTQNLETNIDENLDKKDVDLLNLDIDDPQLTDR